MKRILASVLILALCGCGTAESRLRQSNTVENGVQENKQEAQTQGQMFGAQIGKVEAEVSALKSSMNNTFQKVVEVNAKQVTGIKNELDAKLADSINANAELTAKVAALEKANVAAGIAYKADIEQLHNDLKAGRDIVQYTKEMADEKVSQTRLYAEQSKAQTRETMWTIVAIVTSCNALIARSILASRNRCYRKHDEGHLVSPPPEKWWHFWRA